MTMDTQVDGVVHDDRLHHAGLEGRGRPDRDVGFHLQAALTQARTFAGKEYDFY